MPQYERFGEPAPIAYPHRIRAKRGNEMEQLTLNLDVEPDNEPALVIDSRIQEELMALMTAVLVAVHEARKGGNDDGLS